MSRVALGLLWLRGEERGAQIQSHSRLEQATALLHHVAEDRLLLVQLLGHAHILLAHSGEEKGHRPLCPLLQPLKDARWLSLL